jgi:threonine dehydratase
MFHYRNHGAAYGRILVGFTGIAAYSAALLETLDRVGFRYWEESDNPAYRAYLQ